MEDFPRKLITEWRKLDLPFHENRFIIAVSGGADSCALALGLEELKRRKKHTNEFIIAHFNHSLRGSESDGDADFVKRFAKDLGFQFIGGIAKSGERPQSNGNIEESARHSRYRFLVQMAIENRCFGILTAHTVNDQAETFLLNLLRGSGGEGLSGMEPIRRIGTNEFAAINENYLAPLLIRPLLNWAIRSDTEAHTARRKTEFLNDSMNEDLRFTRVKIRKELIPLMREFNPKIIETLARSAGILRDNAAELSQYEIGEAKRVGDDTMSVKSLKNLTRRRLRRIIREWLKDRRGNLRRIDFNHIEAICGLIETRKSGRLAELPDGETIVKRDGKLHFKPE